MKYKKRDITYYMIVENPTELIGGTQSYQSIISLINYLKKDNIKYDISQGERIVNDLRPPFHIDILVVNEYIHLGHTGKLKCVFFNDRLQETIFYPNDTLSYLNILKDKKNVDMMKNNEIKYSTNIKILKKSTRDGSICIVWQDIRLWQEQKTWIMRYS